MSRVLGSWSESAGGYDEEKENMAYCLILLAKGQTDKSPPPPPTVAKKAAAEVYRCKTCFKSFPSFQALGGHRTSHNKKSTDEKKKSSSSKDEDEIETTTTTLSLQITSTTSRRVHECSVCGAGFVSGQALGGHMRRHRPVPASARVGKRPRNLMPLDLNLPAPPEDDDDDERESDFSLAEKEGIIVFSASPVLMDCPFTS